MAWLSNLQQKHHDFFFLSSTIVENQILKLFFFILASCFLTPLFGSPEEKSLCAWLTVQDYQRVLKIAAPLIEENPDSKVVWKGYLSALGKTGRERKLIRVLHQYQERFPKEKWDREILETAAWAIIEHGTKSPTPLVRLYAFIAAYLGQDAKSTELLLDGLSDPNAHVRSVAVQLSSKFFDCCLQKAIADLFVSERNPAVRIEVIKAIGKMQMKELRGRLVSLLSNTNSFAEEKAAAIESLVNLLEFATREDIEKLTLSKRAGLREFACQVISYTFDKENSDLLIPLLKDPVRDVRAQAVQTFGLLQSGECSGISVAELIACLLADPDYKVALSAAWAITFYDQEKAYPVFNLWLDHPNKDIRQFAAGALARTGKYGIALMQEKLCVAEDPFIAVNLAIGLLAERQEMDKACKTLSQFLQRTNERICWQRQGLINYIGLSDVKFHPLIPHFPETINLLTRLELLNLLAIMEDPMVAEATKAILKSRGWGVTGPAAKLLLTEGDEQSVEVVKQLLEDSDRKIRVQAALTLAYWGREEAAISVLQDSYQQADRELKERILEGLGAVGSLDSIPFLIKTLKEPSQLLRLVAAASLLQCLYH